MEKKMKRYCRRRLWRHAVSCALLLTAAVFGAVGCGRRPAEAPETAVETAAETSAGASAEEPGTAAETGNVAETPGAETSAATESGASKEPEGTMAETSAGASAEEPETAAEDAFYITEITDDIFDRMKGKSFKDDCTLPREDLRYLHVLHVDAEGNTHEGEMVVNYHIAEDVLEILKELYEAGYPIERMRLVDEYGADDETSMRDNNSSSFNFRFISHTTRVSKHGLGLAVDINTLYNPYTKVVDGKRIVEPATGEPYLDRDAEFPYKITEDDLCCRLFLEHGFEWGGHWSDRKDYQHFEVPTAQVQEWYPGN